MSAIFGTLSRRCANCGCAFSTKINEQQRTECHFCESLGERSLLRKIHRASLAASQPSVFVTCDAHPAKGGPHQSRGVHVGQYFGSGASVWACTYRSKKGQVCGSLQLEWKEA